MRENKEARGERTLRLVEEQPIVKISGLSKAFGEKKVLDNIDLEIPQGKIIGLLGPNGSVRAAPPARRRSHIFPTRMVCPKIFPQMR